MPTRNRAALVLSGLALIAAVAPAVWSADPPAEPERPRGRSGSVSGMPLKLLKVEERSITVVPAFRFANAKEAPAEQTYAVDPERTKVFTAEITSERTTEKGQIVRTAVPKPAGLADLKAGQTIRVGSAEGVATRIEIMPPTPQPPAKGAKKGEQKKDGEKK